MRGSALRYRSDDQAKLADPIGVARQTVKDRPVFEVPLTRATSRNHGRHGANGAHAEAPVESARGAAFYPLGDDDDLVRHFCWSLEFPERQQAASHIPIPTVSGVDLGAFTEGTSHPGASLEECTNVDAI